MSMQNKFPCPRISIFISDATQYGPAKLEIVSLGARSDVPREGRPTPERAPKTGIETLHPWRRSSPALRALNRSFRTGFLLPTTSKLVLRAMQHYTELLSQ